MINNFQELEEIFNKFDIDGNGVIDVHELYSVIQEIDSEIEKSQVEEWLAKSNSNGKTIKLAEFQNLMLQLKTDPNEQYRKVFRMALSEAGKMNAGTLNASKSADANGEQTITKAQFEEFTRKNMKMNFLSAEDIDQLFLTVDKNNDKKISEDEFVIYCQDLFKECN